MNLENARSLKREILTRGHQGIARAAAESRGLAKLAFPNPHTGPSPVFARSLSGAGFNSLPETYATGIRASTGRREFTVEVRIQAEQRIGRLVAEQVAAALPARARAEVNVVQVGRVRAPRNLASAVRLDMTRRIRPLQCGYSVGHFAITAGTLGAFVVHPGNGAVFMLSNNHVLADVNQGGLDDPILQPGPADKTPSSRNVAAQLHHFIPIGRAGSNFVDCALAELVAGTEYWPNWYPGLGPLQGVCGIQYSSDAVSKVGRTTGVTHGEISAIELDNVVVDMGAFQARFDDQIEVRSNDGAFSKGGDSGSLIVDADIYGVGLLFAGADAPALTYANPLTTVLNELGVALA